MRRICWSLIQFRLGANQAIAARTCGFSPSWAVDAERVVCRAREERTGIAKKDNPNEDAFHCPAARLLCCSMACGLGAECGDFGVGQDTSRLFGGIEDAIDERFLGWNLVALEPEKDVGLAAHGADFDHLIESEEMRRHTAIDGIGERLVAFVKGFDDRGGVDAGGGAESIATDDGIVRRDRGMRVLGDLLAVFLEPREVLVDRRPLSADSRASIPSVCCPRVRRANWRQRELDQRLPQSPLENSR